MARRVKQYRVLNDFQDPYLSKVQHKKGQVVTHKTLTKSGWAESDIVAAYAGLLVLDTYQEMEDLTNG